MFETPSLLTKECFFIKDLTLSRLLLKNDARFLWLILVPRLQNIQEFYELTSKDQQTLIHEMTILSPLLKKVSSADKLNIGMIGNILPSLHVHLVARHKGDALWPAPVWGRPGISYTSSEKNKLLEKFLLLLEKEASL